MMSRAVVDKVANGYNYVRKEASLRLVMFLSSLLVMKITPERRLVSGMSSLFSG